MFEIVYATSSETTTVQQPTLNEEPPQGFENGVCLLPVVRPEEARLSPTPWLVEGWVRSEGTTILSGPYKSLKSFFGRQLALSIASGTPFLGVHEIHPSAKGRSVILISATPSEFRIWVALDAFDLAFPRPTTHYPRLCSSRARLCLCLPPLLFTPPASARSNPRTARSLQS